MQPFRLSIAATKDGSEKGAHLSTCVFDKVANMVLARRVDEAKQGVRNRLHHLRRHLVGEHVETAVDLHRVGIDDFALGGEGEVDGELRLAHARRANNTDESMAWHVARLIVRRRDQACSPSVAHPREVHCSHWQRQAEVLDLALA
jgi:hypothetical protein